METSIMLLQVDNRKNKETSEKKYVSKLLKFIMFIFLLFSITILSSCFVVPPPRMEVRHGENYEQHDNRNNHVGRHDNGKHRGHQD